METRKEHDSLGDLEVPVNAYYGVQTQRAVVNSRSAECDRCQHLSTRQFTSSARPRSLMLDWVS